MKKIERTSVVAGTSPPEKPVYNHCYVALLGESLKIVSHTRVGLDDEIDATFAGRAWRGAKRGNVITDIISVADGNIIGVIIRLQYPREIDNYLPYGIHQLIG